jgi:uncharacterized repeat protein (TIGR01451 family)
MMSLAAGGLIAALLPIGATWAGGSNTTSGGCIKSPDDPSLFSLLVDASSSCAALSSNMTGCQVDSHGSCTISNGTDTITVQLTQGSVGGTTPISWQVTNSTTANPKAGTVDFSIEVGATGGGTCGWSYSPGSSYGVGTAFLKSNGSIQKINDIYFCSDFQAPPASLPRLSLTKTVMAEGGNCDTNGVDLLDAKTGDKVEYCYVVENLGNGSANNLLLVDDLGTPSDTSDDLVIPLTGLDGGVLAPGAKATGQSSAITMTAAGKLVNTATVAGESVDFPNYEDAFTASDTATVNVVQALVTCPDGYQEAVDQMVDNTGDFSYAVLLNPKKPQDVSVCVPNSTNVQVRGVSCIDECILKTDPDCSQTPLPAGCSPQVCQSSGAWTAIDASTGQCGAVTDTGGKIPYCWEVEQDLNQDCTLNETQPMTTHEVTTRQIHSNPYVYQSCVKSGGRKVCTTYCYLYPGENANVCPSTSIIY